jgi:lecithin:cholesterol acyltransferase
LARLRHLVVLVPGIGGSVLAEPGASPGGTGRPAPVGAMARPAPGGRARYSTTPPGLIRALRSPSYLDIERYPQLEPTGLVHEVTVLPPLLTLPGYQRLGAFLRTTFDDVVMDTYRPPAPVHPDTDVLRFPYDFRQSVAVSAQRLAGAVTRALAGRGTSVAGRPVIVVAHSLGGLVARYWLAVLDGWRTCAALITLGTPFRGAPKALDWLVNGAGTGGLRDPRLTRVIRGWPSMYELLPQYDAVLDGYTGIWSELTALPPDLVARDRELAAYGHYYGAMAAVGREVHEQIRDGLAAIDPAQAPQLVPFMGRGHATPNLVIVESGRLRVRREDPPWRGNVGWRGDGTVPMPCAIPPELSDRPDLWRVRPERHGELGSIIEAVDQLGLFSGEPVPIRGGEAPERPWVALDIEEFTTANIALPVRATLLPDPGAGRRASMAIAPLDAMAGTVQRFPFQETGSAEWPWQGVIRGQPPGRYVLSVEIDAGPGVGLVVGSATFIVLHPADLDRETGW